ncbi:5'-nucleotidase domain-containing protein 1 isoform X2 [Empidonax traillii]|uniref:5'-nucleotidase domain-containing protein 1 isoform X2 n=1 Tax=Empidonax traillii TaxID=164674 RepID=UPI000FFD8D11|nr:5'-nucleotidase domain-containing protein 1 isoform X2 [Empidonax traillii]
MPGSPVLPLGPGGPGGPMGPLKPFVEIPAGPGSPGAPGSPFAPWAPGRPGGPMGPLIPGIPDGPLGPGSPLIPGTPLAPCGPIGPGNPGSPAWPVSPFGPGRPGCPLGPARPCSPGYPGFPSAPEDCGTYFPEVKNHPDKYLQRCPESVKKWLKQLKNAGKILLLITSSHSDYCRLLCEHVLGNDFEDYFDILITNALKPGFFSHTPNQRPFRTLENDEEQEALPSLDKPGWYSQGNATQLFDLLKKITGKLDPKVVYFGDSMHSDIFPARHYSNWETVFILEELLGDKVTVPAKAESEPLEKKGKYEGDQLKAPYFVSKQWGSFFMDRVPGLENAEETLVRTWSCKCISTYSTIAIPSLEAIADLPLDYRFTRFSSNSSATAGYYPSPPRALLPNEESVTVK